MEKSLDEPLMTIRSELPSGPQTQREAILVHIYPTGPEMGTRYVVDATPLVLGRGDNCEIHIHDNSVSRRHALVAAGDGGHTVSDLGSTNGTFLNDVPVVNANLKDGDYLRVGNCIYRFLTGGNLEAEYHEEIYRLTIVDALTQIPNKRHLLEFLEREMARSHRFQRPLTLMFFDIDHFKRINDARGHLAGDSVLRDLAAVIKATMRTEELFARYGGEEFAVVLPETTAAEAVPCAERLRAAVAGHEFEYDGERFPVTISLGVASTQGKQVRTPEELILQADRAMYRAKEEGRNCVCVWTEEEEAPPMTKTVRRKEPEKVS